MNAENIKAIIAAELLVEPDIHDVWGLDMTQCLIEPQKQVYEVRNDATETYEL